MNEMNPFQLPAVASTPILNALWRASWQGAIAVLVIWGICQALPRLPASARCWLWRMVLVKFVLTLLWPVGVGVPVVVTGEVPAAAVVAAELRPAMPTPMPPSNEFVAARPEATERRSNKFEAARAAVPNTPSNEFAATRPEVHLHIHIPVDRGLLRQRTPLVFLMLFAGYLLGVAVCLVRLVGLGLRTRRFLLGSCEPLRDAETVADAGDLARRFELRAMPSLLTSAGLRSSLLVSAIRPAIVLPAAEDADTDREARRLMIAHEMAHLRRHDLAWGWLAAAAHTLFFFHPLVWLARREEDLAREMDCDALAVAACGSAAAAYGALLVQAATRGANSGRRRPLAALGIANEVGGVRRRLVALQTLGSPLSARRLRFLLATVGATAALAIIPWRIVAARPGAPRNASPPGGGAVVALPLSSSMLQGRVVTPAGAPVGGASVSQIVYVSGGAKALAAVRSGADGSFALRIAPADKGFPPVLLVQAAGWGLTVQIPSPAEHGQTFTISLRPAARLCVHLLDENGNPAPGMPMRATWLGGDYGDFPLGALHLSGYDGVSDDQGLIHFSGLPQGDLLKVELAAGSRGLSLMSTDGVRLGAVTSDEQQASMHLVSSSSISGRLTFDGADGPAAGYYVIAVSREPMTNKSEQDIFQNNTGRAMSGTDGVYRLEGLRPGSYRVFVDAREQGVSAAAREPVTLRAGQALAGVNFALTPGVLVTGRVTNAHTGAPIPGIWVGGGSAAAGINGYAFYGVTNTDGKYRVRVPAGDALVQLRSNGGVGVFQISPPPSQTYVQRRFVAKRGRALTVDFAVTGDRGIAFAAGHVVDTAGRPVPGAEVYAFGPRWHGAGTVRTDADGAFRFQGGNFQYGNVLKNENVQIFARSPNGSLVSTTPLAITERNHGNLRLTLSSTAAGSITGRVVDRSNNPLAAEPVRLLCLTKDASTKDAGNVVLTIITITDANGRYTIPALWTDLRYMVGYRSRSTAAGTSYFMASGPYVVIRPGEARDTSTVTAR